MQTPPPGWWGCDGVRMESYDVALVLAALGEYAQAHPELVGQVDQAEAQVLTEWGDAD